MYQQSTTPQPMQPMAYYPPPAPAVSAPNTIVLNNVVGGGNSGGGMGSLCAVCGCETNNVPRKKVGKTLILWTVFLFLFTGCCCFIPFCRGTCHDIELMCVKCLTTKSTIPADCCWFLYNRYWPVFTPLLVLQITDKRRDMYCVWPSIRVNISWD